MIPLSLPVPRGTDDPRREIVLGGMLAGLFLLGGVGWSAFARLDAAAVAPGVVKVSGERQAVQSLAGGIVSALDVTEGARVRAGQVLIEFASAEVLAQERALASRAIGLQAELARLEAERLRSADIAFPPAFAALRGADRADAERALAMELAELRARRAADNAADAVLRQRIVQVSDQISGSTRRQASNARQRRINAEELATMEGLLARGYTTKTRVLALRRQAAALDGDTGAQAAEIARLHSAAGETRMQILSERSDRAKTNAERQRAAEAELQTALPQWSAARSQLDRTRLRAPVSGAVVGLAVHTIGGVAAPGERLMEIVPDDRSVAIETQIANTDAADLRVGQPAQVHLLALHGARDPIVRGTVSRVSADSLVDERSGRSFYTAAIRIDAAEIARLQRETGATGALKPGAPVQVSVTLRARTALQYWLEPLTGWFSRSLHEQ